MSELPRIGTTHGWNDGIEDAEFVEVGAATPTSSPSKRIPIDFRIISIAIFGGLIAWMLVVSVLRGVGIWPTEDEQVAEIDAQHMLAEWSLAVTGSLDDRGFILADGPGAPGEKCDDRATQVLRFGGFQLVGEDAPELYDAFVMAIVQQDTKIGGAFWFDPAASTLTIRNSQMLDLNDKPRRALPDSTVAVEPRGDGTLMFRGTKFHTCEIEE